MSVFSGSDAGVCLFGSGAEDVIGSVGLGILAPTPGPTVGWAVLDDVWGGSSIFFVSAGMGFEGSRVEDELVEIQPVNNNRAPEIITITNRVR